MLAAAEVPTCPLETGMCGAQLATAERRHFCGRTTRLDLHAQSLGHSCSCGVAWQEVTTTHETGACNAVPSGTQNADHFHVCNLVEHNRIFIGGQNLRSHQCQYDGCGYGWAAP